MVIFVRQIKNCPELKRRFNAVCINNNPYNFYSLYQYILMLVTFEEIQL